MCRLKQDLYAAANAKQLLAGQLQEQCDQTQAANAAITKLKQQLEAESAEARATASQLHALKDVLARSMAQQQDTVSLSQSDHSRHKESDSVGIYICISCYSICSVPGEPNHTIDVIMQERQLAAWKARAKSAEEVAASDRSTAAKMQQELSTARGSQANSALKLMELQNSHQQLELKSGRLAEALSAEQTSRMDLEQQV